MDDITKKLIKKVNFELAGKIDLSSIRELSFIPVNIQNDKFFVAISSLSIKSRVRDCIAKVSDCKVEFIHLAKESYDSLLHDFLVGYPNRAAADEYLSTLAPVVNAPSSANNTSNKSNTNSALNILDSSSSDDIPLMNIVDDNNDIQIDADLDAEFDQALNQEFSVDLSQNTIEDSEAEQEQPPEEDKGIFDDTVSKGDISKVSRPETKKLGEILLEENLITESQLEIALAESKAQSVPLGSVLVKLGFVKLKDLKEALGAQMGLKYATAEQLKALPTAISILPEDFVKINKVIPLSMTDKSLVVGMVNPNDTKVINEVVYQTGLKPTVMLVTHVEFEDFINTYYNVDKADTEELLEQINQDEEIDTNQGELWQQVEEEIQASDGAVSQLANKIITMAIERRASDIHIEPMTVGYRVRLRVDGELSEALKIPAKVDSAVISRFKVISKMNIAEHRRPQDGSFTLKFKNRAQDFRVNTLPVSGREKMVIRVLAPQLDSKEAKADKIEIVGAFEEDIKKIRYLVSSPNGIILASGPTGSGKTTTLYAILRYLNSDTVNVTTIEDPVEIKLEGINQSQVNPKAGITFANSLRAILRQDPDKILIGEIRDFETVEIAISASLTGHLVLSTIHTNSACSTVTRLIEMGAKDYLISSTLSGVVAQRLVRKLCPNCKEEYYPTEEEARMITQKPEEIEKLMHTQLYRPKGCPNCKNTGYLGRLAILEILVINKEIRKMISQHAHDVDIEEYAVREQGMNTLSMACLKHIMEGNTSIEERVRILGLASEE